MIAIVDYKVGNVKAFANVYRALDIPFVIAENPGQLAGASKLILPGVGAFDQTMRQLNASGMRDTLDEMVPHMGWNDVHPCGSHALFDGLEEGARFYFLHSYFFKADEASKVLATSVYGESFACAVGQGTVFGVQFHPEKSHGWGARLLRNFADC